MTALAPAGGSAAVIPFVYAAAPSMNWPASRRPDTLQDVLQDALKDLLQDLPQGLQVGRRAMKSAGAAGRS